MKATQNVAHVRTIWVWQLWAVPAQGCCGLLWAVRTRVADARAELSDSVDFKGVGLALAGESAMRPAGRCLSNDVSG